MQAHRPRLTSFSARGGADFRSRMTSISVPGSVSARASAEHVSSRDGHSCCPRFLTSNLFAERLVADILYLVEAGGAVMYPLLLLAVIGLAVAIERTLVFREIGRVQHGL